MSETETVCPLMAFWQLIPLTLFYFLFFFVLFLSTTLQRLTPSVGYLECDGWFMGKKKLSPFYRISLFHPDFMWSRCYNIRSPASGNWCNEADEHWVNIFFTRIHPNLGTSKWLPLRHTTHYVFKGGLWIWKSRWPWRHTWDDAYSSSPSILTWEISQAGCTH